MEIIFTLAINKDGFVGCDGSTQQYHTEDLKRFKNMTMGYPVVMDTVIWESLPVRPLPNRPNIVLTSREIDDSVITYENLQQAIFEFRTYDKMFVIGGSELFLTYIDYADALDITYIDIEANSDYISPFVDLKYWEIKHLYVGENINSVRYKR